MFDLLHRANIAAHIGAGLAAMALGGFILAQAKGTAAHRRWGGRYYRIFAVVVATATAGFLLFRPDAALAAVTVLTAYLMWSGRRAVRLRGERPGAADIAAAAFALAAGTAFLIYLAKGGGAMWKPAVTRPISCALVFWGAFDLAKLGVPAAWRLRGWRLEHGAKLINTLGGLISAGSGTVLAAFKPWSQIVPGVVTFAFLLFYLTVYGRRHLGPAVAVTTSTGSPGRADGGRP